MSTMQPQMFDAQGLPTNVEPQAEEKAKLTNAEYHAHGATSNSRLKVFAESRKLYKAIYVDRSQVYNVTPAMQLGSLVHAMVLEPDAVSSEYVRGIECDRRTTAGKAAYSEFIESVGSREVIKPDMWEQAAAITKAIDDNSTIQSFMEIADCFELPHFWIDPKTGAPCRCKFDAVSRTRDVIFDFKITTDVSPEAFAKLISNLNYDGQAAWYSDGYRNLAGCVPNFVFVAVQKEPPYEVGFYELHESDIDTARQRNARLLESLRYCEMSNDWELPHEKEVQKLRLPRFAAYRDEYKSF